MLSWSSGKDCAWALHLLRQQSDIHVAALLTTFNQAADRVAMHAVRRALVETQAERLGLPLWAIDLPWPCNNEQYREIMAGVIQRAILEGFHAIAFGDLFLDDIRGYRESQLSGTGMEPLFPVWKIPTLELAHQMLAAGVRAKVTCIDPTKLDPSFAGREYDEAFLQDLPPGIDPCGERGEFHTFVYAGPLFRQPIDVISGEVVTRDGFVFADVLPVKVLLPTT